MADMAASVLARLKNKAAGLSALLAAFLPGRVLAPKEVRRY